MREIVVTEMMSLDGVVDSPGGGEHPHAGWTFKDVELLPEAYGIKGREQEEAGALLLGRVTYEEFAPVWPSMTEEFPRYNAMPRYVVSRTLTDTSAWEATVLGSVEEVRALKEQDGAPVIVHGSPTLAQGLAAAGLVDRYHLMIFPLLLGGGKRLFADGPKQGLRLVSSETFANGVVTAVYDVTGRA